MKVTAKSVIQTLLRSRNYGTTKIYLTLVMYYADNRWCSNIRRKEGIREKGTTGKETYLTDKFPGALSNMFVISKEFPRPKEEGTYFRYTAFESYPEIYKYLISIRPEERRLHEIVGEYKPQKPRFDIDVDRDKYLLALKIDEEYENDSIMILGNRVKDMVIQSILIIMKLKGYELELERDFMIFSSHGLDSKGHEKCSYHIILNRYFHHGCAQATAFYRECNKVSTDPKLFELLVDGSVYRKGGSLRMMWSTKVNNLSRVKKYTPEFTYCEQIYRHTVDMEMENEDADEELEEPSAELQQMFILANSLISFVDEASPMPIFSVPRSARAENECLTEEVYEECKKLIKAWDVNKDYEVEGTEDGRITLKRLQPAFCPLCERIHEKMGTFCYLGQAQLFWHCGHAQGKGSILIGRIGCIRTSAEAFVEGIYSGMDVSITFQDTDGSVIRRSTSEVNYGPATLSIEGSTAIAPRTEPRKLGSLNRLGKLSGSALTPSIQKALQKESKKPEKILPEIVSIPVTPKRTITRAIQPELLELSTTSKEMKAEEAPGNTAEEVQAPPSKPPRLMVIKDPVKTYRTTRKWVTPQPEETPVETAPVSASSEKKYSLKNKPPPRTIVFG